MRPWLLGLALALSASAGAHELTHEITQAQAVVLRLAYSDGNPFAFEAYEIYPHGGRTPVQLGRTDAHGRIAFLPPQAGRWRLRAWSEDGHGVDLVFTTGTAAATPRPTPTPWAQLGRIFLGLAVLLALFAAIHLYLKRRRT
ncbi:MAG: ABC transporter permease [Burkholderiales bacterium]|nr:ABC transporter permease [Burkholderiales bacterium]